MRAIFVIDSFAIGGAQKHLCQLVGGLSARGHKLEVFCLNDIVHPVYRRQLESAGVPLHVLGRVRVATGMAVWQLRKTALLRRSEMIVSILFVSTVVGRLAARTAGIQAVTCLQARNIDYRSWQNSLLRFTARWNTFAISNSQEAIGHAAEHEGLDTARSAFVPNGIEVPEFMPKPNWKALGWNQLTGRRVIGSVGRLHPQKGYDLLLAALKALESESPDLALLLVGRGPAESALRAQARLLGIEDRVVFAGERTDVPALLQGLTLYVQPSRFEGMPNALMEAMASGVPVVASRVDGIHELVSDVTGWLVPPQDVRSLAAGLAGALNQTDVLEARAAAGCAFMRTNFSLVSMIDAYEDALGRASDLS